MRCLHGFARALEFGKRKKMPMKKRDHDGWLHVQPCLDELVWQTAA
jgi:hypothetical protein